MEQISSNIKHMVVVTPRNTTPELCLFFFFKEAVNGKPPAPQCKPLSIIFSEHSN